MRGWEKSMSYLEEHFPNYDCDKNGNVFKDGKQINPFKSNKYLQIYLRDKDNKKKICGVHTLVAMKYLNYFDGCVVHHKDRNTHNNCLDNLEVYERSYHSSTHAKENIKFYNSRKGKTAWNRGMKMPQGFCEKCSKSAKRRGFNGNQYVKKDQYLAV